MKSGALKSTTNMGNKNIYIYISEYFGLLYYDGSTRWCSWLRHCATSRKVAGSTPDGVIGFFH